MKVWTIQTLGVWERLQRDGILYGPEALDLYPQIEIAYKWMIEQMIQRIGPPPKEGHFPLWAWYQWSDETKRRTDLRSTAHLPGGVKGVRLECEIDEKHLLLSDFMVWHSPLNYGYVAFDEAEYNAFYAEVDQRGLEEVPGGLINDPAYHMRLLKSWERIFDLDVIGDPSWTGGQVRAQKAIQATFWALRLNQVKNITLFTGRRSRYERKKDYK